MTVCVKYQAATYSGVKMVHNVEDEEEAIQRVRGMGAKTNDLTYVL
jgi:hypothetical protein